MLAHIGEPISQTLQDVGYHILETLEGLGITQQLNLACRTLLVVLLTHRPLPSPRRRGEMPLRSRMMQCRYPDWTRGRSPASDRSMPNRSAVLTFAVSLLFLFLASSHAASPRSIIATVQHIADGDSVTALSDNNTKLRIRLLGIDAPEIANGAKPGQPYGEEARDCRAGTAWHDCGD